MAVEFRIPPVKDESRPILMPEDTTPTVGFVVERKKARPKIRFDVKQIDQLAPNPITQASVGNKDQLKYCQVLPRVPDQQRDGRSF